jgi:hypothetical protein
LKAKHINTLELLIRGSGVIFILGGIEMSILVICEKPSQALVYSAVLGATKRDKGFYTGNYIWRRYLAPWTHNGSNTGRIMCLRGLKMFPVSLMKVAHENYFYGIKELSAIEKHIIYEMTIKNVTGAQRETNQGWLDIYCAPFDLVCMALVAIIAIVVNRNTKK